jgi:Predicted glycosyltransferases
MEEITLSVVIVNYNVKYFLEQCLYSLRAALQGMEAEVFVVDNNSTDGSVAYLKPNFPEVTFIENSDNPGFAKANNQAIRLAKGKYILLLNPDTVIGEDSIRSLCYFLEEKPKAGALGVKMIDGNGVFLPNPSAAFPHPGYRSAKCSVF